MFSSCYRIYCENLVAKMMVENSSTMGLLYFVLLGVTIEAEAGVIIYGQC